MLHPFDIDHAGRVVRGRVSLDVVVFIGDEIRPRCPAQTAVLKALWLDGRMVERGAASFEKRTDIVGQPERGENRRHWSGELGGQVVFRDHERNILWNAIIPPDL